MACRQVATPDRLRRVVRRADGTLAVGRTLPGRGAWVCPSVACVDDAARRGAFARAFRAPVPPEAVAAVRAELLEPGNNRRN